MNQNNNNYLYQQNQMPDGGTVYQNNAQYKQMQDFINGIQNGIQQVPQNLIDYLTQLMSQNASNNRGQ